MLLSNQKKIESNQYVQNTGNEYELIKRIAFYVFWVFVLILVHTFLMIWIEKIPFDDALWLSFTSNELLDRLKNIRITRILILKY